MAVRLHIKICEAKNVLKHDIISKSDPYVTLRLKSQDKKNYKKTQVISNNSNPVWNEEFDIIAVNPNDTLLINMYDEDVKKDDKIMDELEFPINAWPINGPLEKDVIDLKFKKKKDAGKLIFEIQSFPFDSASDPSQPIGCKVHIKAFDAKDVIKMDVGSKSDPYLRFRIKNKKDTAVQTQVISNTLNPVWNEELELLSYDRKNDIIEVDMLDEDTKKDDKMMNTIEIPIGEHPDNDHYVFDDSVKLKKKNAGKVHFEMQFLPLVANAVQPQQANAEPVQATQEENVSPVKDEEKVEPANDEENLPAQTRDIAITENKDEQKPDENAEPCKFIVKAVKAENLLKFGENETDPYVSFQIKGDEYSLLKTKTCDNNANPVWDQSYEYDIPDRKTAVLLVDLYDEDIKDDEKLMDQLEFPLKEWGIGTHIEYNQDIKLDKKDAGKLYLEFEVFDVNGEKRVDTRELIMDEPQVVEREQPVVDVQEEVVDEPDERPVKTESIEGTIVNACGIPKTNSNGSDVYVVLTAFSHDDKKVGKVKTGIHSNTQDPVWNKDFAFPDAKRGDVIKAELFQIRKVFGDKCIAQVDIELKGLKNNESVKKTVRLEKPNSRSNKITNFGTLTLLLTRKVQFE